MAKKKINWRKILANTSVSFFASLISSITLDSILKAPVPLEFFLEVSLLVAVIQGGLAFCQAWSKAEEVCDPNNVDKGPKHNKIAIYRWSRRVKICKFLSHLVLFD